MTSGYPLLVLPGYEMYQLAHIATFIADRIARHRRTGRGEDGARFEAVRDIAGGHVALDRALRRSTGSVVSTPSGQLPQALDAGTYERARGLVAEGPRWAHVVSLEPIGGVGFAVVGSVPGIGPVGARVASAAVAEAIRHHVLTQPVGELRPWTVPEKALPVPKVPDDVDLAAFVEHLDPRSDQARVIARQLRGIDRRTDASIAGRFAGVDLDAPLIVGPASGAVVEVPARTTRPRPGSEPYRRAADRAAPRP